MADKELSLEELLAQHEALAAKIAEIKSTKKAEVIESIKAQIKAYELTAADLFDWKQEEPKKTRAPRGTAAPKAKGVAKYRNPANYSETWSGKGRKPEWAITYIADGGTLEGLLIKD